MKKVAIFLLAGIVLFCAAAGFAATAEPPGEAQGTSVAPAEPLVVVKERGLLDWTQNHIEATGIGVAPEGMSGAQGKAMARRGAVVDLQRNLLEFLGGVRVDARTTMNDFIAEDRVRTEVQGIINNIELLDGEWDGEAYTVSGRVRLPQLLEIVGPSIREKQPPVSSGAPKTAGRFTGLVIDARHLPLVPTLSFRVLDESRREVYGISHADPKFAAQSGLAAYYNNIEYAKGELRVAANPIVTRAIRLTDDGDIVIPNSAASKARGSSYDFRRECKVIIVCR